MKIKLLNFTLLPLFLLNLGCQPVSYVDRIEMMKKMGLMKKSSLMEKPFLMEEDASFIKEKYTLLTYFAGGRDRSILAISRDPYLELGKGICGSTYNNFIRNDKTLINNYLFNKPNKVKVRADLERHAGGVDKVLYTSDHLKSLIDFSNYCNIINAFERAIPYSERENMPKKIAWFLKENKHIRTDELSDYLRYLCPYGRLTKLDGNKVQFSYDTDHTVYTVHMKISSLKEVEASPSSYYYQLRKKGKALSSKYNQVAPIILSE